jgi:peroxiredoxin
VNRIFFSVAVSLFVLTHSLSAGGSVAWRQLHFRATDGQPVLVQPTKYTVLCFLGTECPLARLYGPRLQKIADEFEKDGVVFLGINSNLQDSPSEIDAFAREHAIQFSMVKDADQSIADALGATRTPEVFVVDADGIILYQGRIDDQYEPGISRSKPNKNELRDAIKSLVDGKAIETPKTQGVGCLITRITNTKPGDDSKPSVTFNRDIAPILNANCVECHREGEIGPMELSDYDEVVGWGQMILEVIDQGRMPPWHADPNVGHFVGERRMDPLSREKIANWIDEGMPEGDPGDLPKPPTWPKEWQFPTDPDDEIVIRDRPFKVPAEGVVEYRYFVVDPKWTEDRWIRAAQVVPGNASVVHHVIVFVRPPDGDRFQGVGWMAAYVPGQRAIRLPQGHARRVPAGSKLVFQMHYTPNGRETDDLTRIGVWSVDPEQVTHEVFTQVAIDHQFEIPPRADQHVVKMSVDSFPPNSRMLGITPHMHLRGKSFQMNAVGPNGSSEPLLSVPRYDFNWQHWYEFANSVDLAAIDRLAMTVTFDNSSGNPFNPAPEEYVSWGDQTWEEMALAFFDVAIPRGGPLRKAREIREPTESEAASRDRRIEDLVQTFMTKMDKDKDGVVLRDETPVTFRKFGFNKIDQDRDGRIDRDEIRLSAAERL